MSYLSKHGTQRLPQWLPLPGQVRNSAGGHAWAVDVWTRLRRFLVLGSEGGSYYASEWKLTRENAKAVEEFPVISAQVGAGEEDPLFGRYWSPAGLVVAFATLTGLKAPTRGGPVTSV